MDEALHRSFPGPGRTAAPRGGAPRPDPRRSGASHSRRPAGEPGGGFQGSRRARPEEERGPVPASGVVRYVTLAEVVELHRRLLQATGGAPGIRDLGALESAVAQPKATF